MSDSMKYIGAATDPGEWWCDKDSKANDLGPGVSFAVRCGEDGGNGPHLICCYGLREDVQMDRVLVETNRILAEYQKPDTWHLEGRTLQGPLHAPKLEKWRSLEDVLAEFKKHVAEHQEYGRGMCHEWWRVESIRNDILWSVTGSYAMANRVIENAGIDALQEIVLAGIDGGLLEKWPFVAVDVKGVPVVFLESNDPEIRKGKWFENMDIRASKPQDAVKA
ncbi:hypothetical protein M0R72_11960 [Candidatus Pacearchaeota archaeon]|nr:hypothetical protein [Candidatus Pacearchaeota archaeon]